MYEATSRKVDMPMNFKKALSVTLLGILCFNTAACTSDAFTINKGDNNLVEVIRQKEFRDVTDSKIVQQVYGENKKKKLHRISELNGSQKFMGDYNRFAFKTFEKIIDTEDNVVYSPLSAYIPLSELYYLSDNDMETEKELKKMVLSESEKGVYWNQYLLPMLEQNSYLVNGSIWLGKDAEPDIDYLKKAVSSDIFKIDFSKKGADKAQLDWVNKWTKGSFNSEKDLANFGDISNKDAKLAVRLVGATYLKTPWLEDHYELVKKDFTNLDKSKKSIDFIHNGGFDDYRYFEDADLQAIKIYMESGVFYLIVPKADKAPKEVLDEKKMAKLLNDSHWKNIDVKFWMPKLKTESSLSLVELFKALGYKKIFEPNLGYSKLLGKRKGFIGEIKQETKVAMDEHGFEGASYTKVDMLKTASVLIEDAKKQVELKADKPYCFMTVTDGFITFMGVQNKF